MRVRSSGRVLAWLSLLAAIVMSSACSTTDTYEQPAPLPDITPKVSLESVWSDSVGDGDNDQLLYLQPYVTDQTVYAVSQDGCLMALDARNGDEQWERDLDREILAGVGADSSHLYVVTLNGELLALSRKDGKEVWHTDLPDEVLAPPQTNSRSVVVQTIDGKVLSFSSSDGKKQWEYDGIVPVLSFRGTAIPYVSDNLVVAAFASGQMMALDAATGSSVWQYTLGEPRGRTELERMVDVDGSPLVSNGAVYAVGYQGRAAAVDLQSGHELWSRKASSLDRLALGYGNIYIAGADGHLQAFNQVSHTEVWHQNKMAYRQLTAPVPVDRYLVVGDFEGYLHVVSQIDGTLVGRTQVDDDGIRVPVVFHNGLVYAYGNGGELVAYRLRPLK